MREKLFSSLQVVVIKVGTTVLTGARGRISRTRLRELARQISHYRERGIKVVLVSSGAIAYGMELLGLSRRPRELAKLQACAALGQGKLMRLYEELFSRNGYHTGQLLLTRDGLDDRKRYLNVRNTLNELLACGAIPVVNENDTVATEEINFGDNDVLAAQVATLINADCLVVLSDIDGLYQKGARTRKIFDHITAIDDTVRSHLYVSKSERSKGGMASKLTAAERVMKAGISMIIANGKQKNVLVDLLSGASAGTLFFSGRGKKSSFKNWLSFSSAVRGTIAVDAGARDALVTKGKSLLAAGITAVRGVFVEGAIVSIADTAGKEIARGIVNFSDRQVRRMKGKRCNEIKPIIGDRSGYEVVHRDNMVIM